MASRRLLQLARAFSILVFATLAAVAGEGIIPSAAQASLAANQSANWPLSVGSHSASTTSGGTMYAATFETDSRIFRIDPGRLTATFVGYVGHEITDVSFLGGALYGIDFGVLYRINLRTGLGTEIGALKVVNSNALTNVPGHNQLLAASTTGQVFWIDPTDAAVTNVGNFGVGIGSSGDLTYIGRTLFATVTRAGHVESYLARINIRTGVASIIGDSGFASVYGLETFGGTLFGATSAGAFLRFNVKTGRATLQWNSHLPVGGLAQLTASSRTGLSSELLGVGQMPKGWSIENVTQGKGIGCLATLLDPNNTKQTAKAEVYFRSNSGIPAVGEFIATYKSARVAFKRVTAILASCKSVTGTSEGHKETGTIKPLSLPSYGNASASFTVDITSQGKAFAYDYLFVRRGDAVMEIEELNYPPVDFGQFQGFVVKALTRLK